MDGESFYCVMSYWVDLSDGAFLTSLFSAVT